MEPSSSHSAAESTAASVQLLRSDAQQLGAQLSAHQAQQMLQLLTELEVWNRRYSLTAITEREHMVRAHLLDSLAVLGDLSGMRIADVGTGAGFPGLPLAIAAPERQFTLIDSVAKKIRFVSHAVRLLRLSNVTPLNVRVETLTPVAPFDVVMARAYGSLAEVVMSVRGLVGPATRVLAFKGRYPADEIELLPRGWSLAGARALRIPGLEAERHILTLVPDPA